MTSVSTLAQSNAIAPEERKERAEMSAGWMPAAAPMAEVAARKAVVSAAELIAAQWVPVW